MNMAPFLLLCDGWGSFGGHAMWSVARSAVGGGRVGPNVPAHLAPPQRKKIAGLKFTLATPEWVRAMSTVLVKHSSTTERQWNKEGVNDIVMGPCDQGSRCVECHTTMNDCVGHPGDVDLGIYVPSPFTIDILKRVADCVCLQCGTPHFPLTAEVRAELMSLASHKRLDAAKKKCPKVLFCGQLHRAQEKKAADKKKSMDEKKKATDDKKKGAPFSPRKGPTPPSPLAKPRAVKRRRDTASGETEHNAEDDDADDDDGGSDDGSESGSGSGSGSGSEDDDDDDSSSSEDEGEGKVGSDSEAGTPRAAASDSEHDAEAESEAEAPSESDASSGSDDDGGQSESDGGGSGRRKSKPKAKRASVSSLGKDMEVTGPVTLAAAKAMQKKPRLMRASKQFASSFDFASYHSRGCGAPVPRYTRDGLRLQATYIIPFEQSVSKHTWPVHNSWRMYQTLRAMPDDIQQLLGFDPANSPVRALLMRYLHVPPRIVRCKKEKMDGSAKGGSSQDENTQALRDVVLRSKKLQQKLKEEKISRHEDLGSVNRTIVWYCPPTSKVCTCQQQQPSSPMSLKAPRRGGCTCAASGRMVKCDETRCQDNDWCTCIPKQSLPQAQLSPHVKTLYRYREIAEQKAAKPPAASGPPGVGVKKAAKTWKDMALDLENALTTYLIGDINKKGAGRKDGKPGLSPWAGTATNSNSLVKRDRAFAARFVGKHGRIRGTMYGKRCDKTARTVASGDIYQNVGEIGVPREIAETLTVCEIFQTFNRVKMIDRLRSNRVDYVMMPNGDLYNTRFLNRDSYNIPMGATCERHIENRDPGVWNRQPTLHKPSIEGAEACLLNHPFNNKRRRTLAINQCLTTATNADFDGDELNLHLGKGQDSRAETLTLMSAPQQIRSQQGDSVIIVLVQNSRLALHLLTDPKTFFRKDEFQQLLFQFGVASRKRAIQRLFERALVATPKPCFTDYAGDQWWSGLQVVSALLPPGIYYGKSGKAAVADGEFEPALIINSEMVSGRLSGKDVGHGESGNLIHTMVQDVGEEVTVAWESGFQRVLNYFLMKYGATMSPADYDMRASHKLESLEVVEKARRWCHQYAQGVDGNYDMRRINRAEKKILDVLGRSRSLVEKRLNTDAEQRQKYGYRRNGVLDLIHSGAKGKMPHFVQMGAMVGQQMPGRGRVVANIAHFNVTMHMPEPHGFVPECYRDGLSPWSFFCAAIGGREGLVHTGSSTPQVGYFQKRLGTNMSDLHAKSDGTIRDCRDQIVQWLYGDDAKDPSNMESNDAKFLTPQQFASPELKDLQQRVLASRAQLYETAAFMPAKFLAPVNFARVFRRAEAHRTPPNHRGPANHGGSDGVGRGGSDGVGGSDEGAAGGRALTALDVERVLAIWLREMERENLLRSPADPRYNLLLDAMIKDALSPWHVVTKQQLTFSQFEFILREIERRLAKACLVSGEAVGPIASQSMGEPATQSTLNQFHFAGAQNTQQLVVSRLNDTANACKKPLAAGMTVFVFPEWSKRRDLVEMVARDIKERRLIDFAIETTVHPPGAWPEEDRNWVQTSLNLQPPKSILWFKSFPTVRIEFDRQSCKRMHLHLMEIATTIYGFFKRGVSILSSGSYADRWILYIALDPEHVSRVSIGGDTGGDRLGTMMALNESAVIACLQESCIRGIPRVTDAMVVALETRYHDVHSNQIRTRSCCPAGTRHAKDCPNQGPNQGPNQDRSAGGPCGAEWAIVTQGSNFDELLKLPAVDFERCATSYVHDVHKLLGIEGARRWLDENLEDLVRRSRVDLHHTKLIADIMTRTGAVTPMTRNGLKNSTDSVCRLLFENVLENIKSAGAFAQTDPLKGVPESILMGIPAAIGTGAVSVIPSPPPPPNPNPNHTTTIQPQASASASQMAMDLSMDGAPSAAPAPAKKPFAVLWGVRKIPCRSRPFRFFQMFVPVLRNGTFCDPRTTHLISPQTPSSSAVVTSVAASSVAAAVVAPNLFVYQRTPHWALARPVELPASAKPARQAARGGSYSLFDFDPQPNGKRFDLLWRDWISRSLSEPLEFDMWALRIPTQIASINHITDINSSECLLAITL